MASIQFGNSAGEARPKVTADDFHGQRKRILTIIHARFMTFENNDRQLFVTFNEWPDKELRCNKSMAAGFEKLVKAGHLPNQTDVSGNPMWAGCRVPMELRGFRNPSGGPDVDKPCPVHPDLFMLELDALSRPAAPVAPTRSRRK